MTHEWSSQRFLEGARAAGRSNQTIEAACSAANSIKSAHPDLPVVLTLNHLAHLADAPANRLQELVLRTQDAYRVFRVKKRGISGLGRAPTRRYRTICVPQPFLMRTQRWIAQHILNTIAPHFASYAFAPNNDLVKAAKRHLGARWLLKMDVRHFFESIPEKQVYLVFRSLGYGALLSFQMARICTRLPDDPRKSALAGRKPGPGLPYRGNAQGHLPQGAPTSPMLANLAMRAFDTRIENLSKEAGWIYTRYADDLAFSRREGGTRQDAMTLSRQVARELERAGLSSHREKTSLAPPGARKILLGTLVDGDRPRLPRAFRDNIETHLFALSSGKIGASAHQKKRGFASRIGMRRHIEGLIAFAHQVNPDYAAILYKQLNAVDWMR